MGIFSKMKDAIFGKKAVAQTGDTAPATNAAAAAAAAAAASTLTTPTAIEEVDVIANLEAMAAANGQSLNWQSSIVDLMKLLGMDSSLAERKELAQELGYAGELNGSAEMNIWLHKAVMKGLAENGGKVPANMLD
ncbi:hypothetical protein LPB140_08495 [Sphingorhabdus lutea]|uniref:DUF3597 domain-containing protein n=1 Tax=Sphingorhabdus lutea TaxID=1913578 RepID=A0A1L3JCF9_9SPHN|nr:DUF3597 domain-containing protein [Sphingorhabdus lutea]APG62821.1 hypothetical protein LPB140_08495 [Sphingorhabdus lutea]